MMTKNIISYHISNSNKKKFFNKLKIKKSNSTLYILSVDMICYDMI